MSIILCLVSAFLARTAVRHYWDPPLRRTSW